MFRLYKHTNFRTLRDKLFETKTMEKNSKTIEEKVIAHVSTLQQQMAEQFEENYK